MLTKFESFHNSLESLSEEEISSKLASSTWSVEQRKWASELLKRRSSFKRNDREEETLSIAKEANFVAREANDLARSSNNIASEAKEFARLASISASKQARWAMYAAIIATVAAIIATMAYIKTP